MGETSAMHPEPIAASSSPAHVVVRSSPRKEITVGAICLVAVVVVGVAGTLIRNGTGFTLAEEGLLVWVNGFRNPVLDGVALFFQVVFAPLGAVIITVFVSIATGIVKGSVVAGIKATVLIGAPCLVAWLLKVLIARPRPDPGLLADPLFHIGGATSFPSGHTVFVAALALFVVAEVAHKRRADVACIPAVALAVVVGLSRVYLGVHYPSDVLASLVVAPAVFVLSRVLWNLVGFAWQGRFRPSR